MFTKEKAINIFWGKTRKLPELELCGVCLRGIIAVNRVTERYYLLVGGVIKSYNGSFNAFTKEKSCC